MCTCPKVMFQYSGLKLLHPKKKKILIKVKTKTEIGILVESKGTMIKLVIFSVYI